jgi:hypothetical protein
MNKIVVLERLTPRETSIFSCPRKINVLIPETNA